MEFKSKLNTVAYGRARRTSICSAWLPLFHISVKLCGRDVGVTQVAPVALLAVVDRT